MKLVIEKYPDGAIYAYRMSEKHFRKAKNELKGERLDPAELDEECNLDCRDSFHMVFDLKGQKCKKPT